MSRTAPRSSGMIAASRHTVALSKPGWRIGRIAGPASCVRSFVRSFDALENTKYRIDEIARSAALYS